MPPSPFSALPPLHISDASPKAISGRTSYLRVRLEFLRYPQVIPILFNAHRFGPPRCLTTASACSWIGHPVSGLLHATLALFRLGFPAAPVLNTLTSLHKRNSLARSSISTTSYSLIVLSPFVNAGFQVLFHSPPGVLFTFPSRYSFAIGQTGIFRLTQRSGRIRTGFHGTRATWETRSADHARSGTGPSPSAARYSTRFP